MRKFFGQTLAVWVNEKFFSAVLENMGGTNNKYCGIGTYYYENCENILGLGAVCIDGYCRCNNDNAEIKTNKDGQKVCAEILNDPNCCGPKCEKCDADQVCLEGQCVNDGCVFNEYINCNGHCLDK